MDKLRFERRWSAISKKLQEKNKIVELWHGGDCPFCGHRTEEEERIIELICTAAEAKKVGKIIKSLGKKKVVSTKVKVEPFRVDNDRLHFSCEKCGFSGGPINYCMHLRKLTDEEALDFLDSFVG